MGPTEVRSAGDTTFILEETTPFATPLEQTQPAMPEANPIEEAKNQISNSPAQETTNPDQSPALPPSPPPPTRATTEKRSQINSNLILPTAAQNDKRDVANPNAVPLTTATTSGTAPMTTSTNPASWTTTTASSRIAPSTTSMSSDKHDIVCPDPTAHRDTKLQEQASTAALYVTRTGNTPKPQEGVLDANNKLSSRSTPVCFHILSSH